MTATVVVYSGLVMHRSGTPATRRALRGASLVAALPILLAFMSACSPAISRSTVALPAPGGWLAYLNSYRAIACLSAVTENTAWSDGDRKHATCIVKNGVLRHRENPGSACYSPEGHTAARQSNLFNSSGRLQTDGTAIDTWMQSPFHAVGVLDPRLEQVGYGSYQEKNGNLEMGAALNVLAGLNHAATAAYPVFWPGNGATTPLRLHWGGDPNPLSSCAGYTAPSGLPLIVQIGSGDLTPVVSASSFTHDGRPLEHCVIDETSYVNPDRTQQRLGRSILGARDAIVLIPRDPLMAGTTYAASLIVNGITYAWSFSTGDAAQGRDAQEFSGLPR